MIRKAGVILLVFCLLTAIPGISFASEMMEDPDCSTEAVDNATDLDDGVYIPDSFSFSGGTGKVKITCPKITVSSGKAYATIVFSSSSYAYVKASGIICYADVQGKNSVFTIPIALNQNNTVLALTTKMSTPHEIEYTVFAQLSAAHDAISSLDELDDTAPDIAGFVFREELDTCRTQYLKIFQYDCGTLVEIDTGRDTAKAEENTEEWTPADYAAALYRNRVLKYLIVDEQTVIPAGLEKQYILIRRPVTGICVAAQSIAVPAELIVASMIGSEDNNAGTLEHPDYRSLLLNKVHVLIADSSMLPLLEGSLPDRLAALGIAGIVDRSAEETDPEAAEQWQQVYSLLFQAKE